MKLGVFILFCFPLTLFSQLLSSEHGPVIFLPKKYIKQQNIKELTFDDYYIEHKKPRHLANYKFVFDTSGTAITKIVTGAMADSSDFIEDLNEFADVNLFDTIQYDSRKNIIKTTFYGNKDYYTYDSLNRIIEHVSYGQSLEKETYVYDKDKMIMYLYQKQIWVGCNGESRVSTTITNKFCYQNELLYSVEKTTFEKGIFDYTIEYQFEYKSNILYRIRQLTMAKNWHRLLIKVQKSK
jgi:hypothetical protein